MIARNRANASACLVALCLASTAPAAASASLAIQGPQGVASESIFQRDDQGRLVHRQSGYIFPSRLDSFAFVGEMANSPSDVFARYGAAGPSDGKPWLDLFVYLAEQPLDAEARSVGAIIEKTYRAVPIPAPAPLPPAASDGQMRWYLGKIGNREILTGYVIIRRGEWLIKARATSPGSAGSESIGQLLQAIAAIDWGWAPTTAANEKVVAAR